MVLPSFETPHGYCKVHPVRFKPRSLVSKTRRLRIPLDASQMNASTPDEDSPLPTMTEPSPDAAFAVLLKPPPVKSPSPTIPLGLVQRNASRPDAEVLPPTTTEPSSETP